MVSMSDARRNRMFQRRLRVACSFANRILHPPPLQPETCQVFAQSVGIVVAGLFLAGGGEQQAAGFGQAAGTPADGDDALKLDAVDVVIMVSDNESWVDGGRHRATATMHEWARIKRHNPDARLVCIDLQPYGTTQANEQPDILNVGGFGDAVFDVIAQFAAGGFGAGHWVEAVESVRIEGA